MVSMIIVLPFSKLRLSSASIQDGTTRKAASVSALSLSSRDSESTPSSSKDASQYPSTVTLVTNTNTLTDTKTIPLQEPDVIASTKTSCSRNNIPQDPAPIAPPRRKKKNVKNSVSSLSLVVCSHSLKIFLRYYKLFCRQVLQQAHFHLQLLQVQQVQ